MTLEEWIAESEAERPERALWPSETDARRFRDVWCTGRERLESNAWNDEDAVAYWWLVKSNGSTVTVAERDEVPRTMVIASSVESASTIQPPPSRSPTMATAHRSLIPHPPPRRGSSCDVLRELRPGSFVVLGALSHRSIGWRLRKSTAKQRSPQCRWRFRTTGRYPTTSRPVAHRSRCGGGSAVRSVYSPPWGARGDEPTEPLLDDVGDFRQVLQAATRRGPAGELRASESGDEPGRPGAVRGERGPGAGNGWECERRARTPRRGGAPRRRRGSRPRCGRATMRR